MNGFVTRRIRVNIVNNSSSVTEVVINNQRIKMNEDQCVEVDVDSSGFTAFVTGFYNIEEFNDAMEEAKTEENKLKTKLAIKALEKMVDFAKDLVVQVDCTYKFTNLRDGETITLTADFFNTPDYYLFDVGEMMFVYPKVETEGATFELISATGKDVKKIIKKYSKFSLTFNLFDLIFGYPLRRQYYSYLCKPKTLKKNILKVKKFQESADKKNTNVGCLKEILVIIAVLFFVAVVLPVLMVKSWQPALISSDYTKITLEEKEYIKTDVVPTDAVPEKTLFQEAWTGARIDGFSRLEQSNQECEVLILTDSKGTEYLWLLRDGSEYEYVEYKGDYIDFLQYENIEIFVLEE